LQTRQLLTFRWSSCCNRQTTARAR
jgi:hypothetical protein